MALNTPLLPTTPVVAILAGGNSQRMGRDKALLPFAQQGETWLERLCNLAMKSGANVIVVGREHPKDWSYSNINFFPDDAPCCGPIGGLATALRHTNSPVALVGCDMPRLTEQAFQWLLAQQVSTTHPDGVVAVAAGQIEPLFSIYSPSLLAVIEGEMQRGDYSLRGIIQAGQFTMVDTPDWLVQQLAGVNTPQELEAWREEK